MRIENRLFTRDKGWTIINSGQGMQDAQLVLVFGSGTLLSSKNLISDIRSFYPGAMLFGCSTAGEILGQRVYEDSIAVSAVLFEHTRLKGCMLNFSETESSRDAGEILSRSFGHQGLVHVLVLCKGLNINGSALVQGIRSELPESVTVTGGLAGDGARFKETSVLWNDQLMSDSVAAVGFYSERLKIGYGSLGGWDPFGPERLISRSSGNVLYELDNKSALELYKKYLGRHAGDLPASGLLFPLSLRVQGDSSRRIVRTILSVNEEDQSMTFAGDMPQGGHAQLMKANLDHLVDGAKGAAEKAFEIMGSSRPALGLLISCVGRKLIMKQRVEEEVEVVQEVLGTQASLTGFYSYGEISPLTTGESCELHNQTMTITTFAEY